MPDVSYRTIDSPLARWTIAVGTGTGIERVFVGHEQDLRERVRRNPIKQNAVRTVGRVSVPDAPPCIVKCFHARTGLQALRERWQARSTQEWTHLRALHAAGIPIPTPIARMEWHDPSTAAEDYLFLEEIPDAVSLRDWMIERARGGLLPRGIRDERTLLANLAALIDALCAVGFYHQDFHAGNILISPSRSRVHPLLIDVHRGRAGAAVIEAERRAMIAQMAYSISRVARRSTVWRFFFACESKRFTSPRAREAACREAFAEMSRLREQHVRSRTRRPLEGGSLFAVEKIDGIKIYRKRTIPAETVRAWISRHENAVTTGTVDVIKRSDRGAITRLAVSDGAGITGVYVKEFVPRGIARRLAGLWQGTGARRGWVAHHGCVVRRIPVPEALAAVEGVSGPRAGRSYLITREVRGAIPSNRFAELLTPRGRGRSRQTRQAFLWSLARLLRSLHMAGIFHRDLKANNILVRAGRGGRVDCFLLDLDRVRFGSKVEMPRRLLNLAQLNAALPPVITRADRLRAFRSYACWDRGLGRDRETIARLMEETVARKHLWPTRT